MRSGVILKQIGRLALIWLCLLWVMNCGGSKESVQEPVASEENSSSQGDEAAKTGNDNDAEPVLSEEMPAEEGATKEANKEDAVVDEKAQEAALQEVISEDSPAETNQQDEKKAESQEVASTSASQDQANAAVGVEQPASQEQASLTPEEATPNPEVAKEVKKEKALPSRKKEDVSRKREAYSGPSFKYIVEKGETLSKIANLIYGQSAQWQQIHGASSGLSNNPNLIFPGDVLNVPLLNQKAKDFAEAYTKNYSAQIAHVTVKRGDCLRKIARKYFGDELFWRQIWKENAHIIAKPALIFPGMELEFTLMTKEKKDPVSTEEAVSAPQDKPAAVDENKQPAVDENNKEAVENIPAESSSETPPPKEEAPKEEKKNEDSSSTTKGKDGYSADDI